jgi:hypothetical protein
MRWIFANFNQDAWDGVVLDRIWKPREDFCLIWKHKSVSAVGNPTAASSFLPISFSTHPHHPF